MPRTFGLIKPHNYFISFNKTKCSVYVGHVRFRYLDYARLLKVANIIIIISKIAKI